MVNRKVSNQNLVNEISGALKKSEESRVSDPPTHIKHYRNEQQAIIRQSCLKSAVQLLEGKVNGKTNIENTAKTALEIAELFESWVNR
jgi:hypothetical protein